MVLIFTTYNKTKKQQQKEQKWEYQINNMVSWIYIVITDWFDISLQFYLPPVSFLVCLLMADVSPCGYSMYKLMQWRFNVHYAELFF